ncbi:AraC family transcriptional regulator [Acetobacterium tundrae]|uniref:Helix-turn-helix domain-containing protein n=1 Tax=Acetobacterium tundrae TaxID=132932 RepID=A0ABR6WJ20_9FIRM|nr:AraC family transcriptional regulator [Acetobacterium tundrae]MBC3796493.1 helix-turn-helix domain-containing protein [Acetobacterium tundrae]
MKKIKSSRLDKELNKIQTLVGDITAEDLKNVDCYFGDRLSIFVPSVGYCQYAIRPNHTHPSYSFVLFFSEKQNFLKDPIELPLNHYLAAILSPEIPHEEEIADQFTRYVAIFINKDFYEERYNKIFGRPIEKFHIWKQFSVPQEIMIDIKSFMSESESKIPGYENILEALTEIITIRLIRSQNRIQTEINPVVKKFDMEQIIEFMEQHFGDQISLGDLSKKVGMSKSQFSRCFRQETGLAPIEYFIKIRIEKGQKLLRSGEKNITEIAEDCGFGSTAHFSTCFKNHLGISPSMYKKLYKEHN